MAQFTLTIPDEKVDNVKNAMVWRFPIPKDELGQPLFTPAQWIKESVRRWMIRVVADYNKKLADAANPYTEDNTLIS